jgi:hypothetical protein
MEIASTMGVGSFGQKLDLHFLIDELEKTTQSPFDSNFTSERMVTTYLGDDSPTYTLYCGITVLRSSASVSWEVFSSSSVIFEQHHQGTAQFLPPNSINQQYQDYQQYVD